MGAVLKCLKLSNSLVKFTFDTNKSVSHGSNGHEVRTLTKNAQGDERNNIVLPKVQNKSSIIVKAENILQSTVQCYDWYQKSV